MQTKKPSKILLALAIGSILFIGVISLIGFIKNKQDRFAQKNINTDVLGEVARSEPVVQLKDQVGKVVQNTLQTTKDTVTEKMVEVEKRVVEDIEKQVTNLTTSQVKIIKTQICKNWGIVSNTPTLTP